MFDPHTSDWYDRSLEKALTNSLVDRYFSEAESWLRAILRMCIFSLTYTDRQTALLIECPNQAVAKRLSRKLYPLQDLAQRLSRRSRASKRVIICYLEESQGIWRCFDTKTNVWKDLKICQVPTLGNW
jgi:hypothetical protein